MNGSCDPETETVVDCGFTSLGGTRAHKVMVTAGVQAVAEDGAPFGYGSCHLIGSVTGAIAGSASPVRTGDHGTKWETERISLVGLPGTRPAGFSQDCGIVCNETAGDIKFNEGDMTALSVSPF